MDLGTHKVRWGMVIWKIISDKGFRFSLSELIFYGLINAREKRGQYASGVIMLQCRGYEEDIVTPIPFK